MHIEKRLTLSIMMFLTGAILLLLPVYLLQAQVDTPADGEATEGLTQLTDTAQYMPLVSKLPSEKSYGEVISVTYGINFINSVDHPADMEQIANGIVSGADWNRWPLYWPRIETSEGVFDWSQHDEVVQFDMQNGFQVNAILLGTPGFYVSSRSLVTATENDSESGSENEKEDGGDNLTITPLVQTPKPTSNIRLRATQATRPRGLFDPIYSDGSDIPGPGKTLNPDNKWAIFVFNVVNRYKPGGVLAQQNSWPAGRGITHWEMWNEPNLSKFWDGTRSDYARLLKVGYFAAKEADPDAQIIFAGLADTDNLAYYDDILALTADDPMAAQYGYYHDIFAAHSYANAWNSWLFTWKAGRSMTQYGLDKPIWLNETGVPAWDDYPGPVWDPKSGYRSTLTEQSDYLLQQTMYALYAGADAIFHFQLYDGCGNQPAFTDFPPHSGELCDGNGEYNGRPCAGDAFGLFRNRSDEVCFSQHPQAGTPRPYFQTFQLVTAELQNVAPYWRERRGDDDDNPVTGTVELIALYRPSTQERLVGMWTLSGNGETIELEATGSSARLIDPVGNETVLTPVEGKYTIQLPGATNQNSPIDPNLYMIGGRPYLLIEQEILATP